MEENNYKFRLNKERKNDIIKDFLWVIVAYIMAIMSQIFYNEISLPKDFKLWLLLAISSYSMGLISKTICKYILIAKNGYNKLSYTSFRKQYIGWIIIIIAPLELFKWFILTNYNNSMKYNISSLLTSIIITAIFTWVTLKKTKEKFTD